MLQTEKTTEKPLVGKAVWISLSALAAAAILYLLLIRSALMPGMKTIGIELIVFFAVLLAFVIALVVLVISALILLVSSLASKNRERVRLRAQKTGRRAVGTAVLALVLAVVVCASQLLAYTPPIVGADAKPLPGSIAKLERVKVNGTDQWITIRGKDESKPVLLFLAGGPGGSQLAASRSELFGLEDHFVVVDWDQPGAGKSYFARPIAKLTPETYVQDGIALTQYLCERFSKQKVYLVGESWGSVLGIWMAQKRPDLFAAFVGTGQMVSFLDTENECYDHVMKLASERGDAATVQKLNEQGRPPYYGNYTGVTMKMASYLMYLYREMRSNPEVNDRPHNTFMDLEGVEYGVLDKVTYLLGMTETLGAVYQQLYDRDMRKEATELAVPMYIFKGRHDINAPVVFTEEYVQLLKAPHVELIWFEHSGHTPWVDENDLFVENMVNIVLKNNPVN